MDTFRILIELKSLSTQVGVISSSISCFFFIFLVCWCSFAVSLALLVRLYATHISRSDFVRLVSAESNPLVVQFIFPYKGIIKWYGWYYYWSFVKGHRFYTASKEPLEFPESCEVVLTHQPSKLDFFRNPLSGRTQHMSQSPPQEENSAL